MVGIISVAVHSLSYIFFNKLRVRLMDLNNSQQPNNVGSSCICVGSGVQTDATTPNSVGPAVHCGKGTTHKTL